MAIRKQEPPPQAAARNADQSRNYEVALQEYAVAIGRLRQADFAGARQLFLDIEAQHREESELVDRARMYARVCAQRLDPGPPTPQTAEGCYARAVMLSNSGRWDEAIDLLSRALRDDPSSVKALYARACAWALKGQADRAVNDLRGAIMAEPALRFQAANDPDFERVREEPAFIDLIEPTPAGA